MANLVKTKASISLLSLSILVLVPMLESNFYAPVTIKRWTKLDWNDFQGLPQVFSRFGAAISSTVYLEYDSAAKSYRAYAGQDNMRSWVREHTKGSDYSLNHEQYHFNITELCARQVNRFIEDNPGEIEYRYWLEVKSIREDLTREQRNFDIETGHGQYFGAQRRLEFKIDSALALNTGWVLDRFSGATVYLPSPPSLSKAMKNNVRYREYTWGKYGMAFNMTSMQSEAYDDSSLLRIERYYINGIDTLKSIKFSKVNGLKRVMVTLKDSLNQTAYSLWVLDQPNLYNASAKFSNNSGDTTGYSQIARSFLNSFRILDTDSLWLADFKEPEEHISDATPMVPTSTVSKTSECVTIEDVDRNPGFYTRPIWRSDGAFLLPFDDVVHDDSLHAADILFVDRKIHVFAPTNEGQVYFIPAKNVTKKSFQIQFGYTLKKDSIKPCYTMHHHTMIVTR